MVRRLWPVLLLFMLGVLILAACGGGAPATETAGPAEPLAATTPASPSPVLATDAPTLPPPSATPTTPAPTKAPTSPPSDTPSPILPGDTPAPSAVPSATEPPQPTATPSPVPPAGGDPASVRVELQLVTGGLDRPLGITHAGDGSGRLFVVEKVGRIRVVQDGALAPIPFLDISERVGSSQSEQGLLGLAFHPDFAGNGAFFVNYTDRQGNTVVSRFALSDDPAQADPDSEVMLLTLVQPAANHNGGHLAFGPDGYLYIGMGDGGASGDRFGNGQNGATLLGAMLRLDVDGGQPYAVPADNPFVGDPAVRDEIWAIGLRNPWRYAFDRLTGDLYIADVGQNQYEEVNFQPADSPGGQNYGWPIMEATRCFPADRACDPAGLSLPVAEYDHSQGCSVTGGSVYRGQAFPILTGIYLYGDYCSGRIWGLAGGRDGNWQAAELARVDARISAFGEDEAGEIYLVDIDGGGLFQIIGRER